MKQDKNPRQIYEFSHMLVLSSYSILAIALIGESFLMNWERWPLIPIAASIILCWILHIRQVLTASQRLWVYTLVVMGTFFFYGIHVTSTYDMGLLMLMVIMIFTTTGESKLIWAALITYYITLTVDIIKMVQAGTVWDGLMITRTILHIVIMFMACWLARIIIRQWSQLFHRSDERIEKLNETTQRMNRFIANQSHELRTPINAVSSIADLLLDKAIDDECRTNLNKILSAGQRMSAQTDKILDYAELETGTLTVNLRPCRLSALFSDLTASVRHAIPEDLELVFDISPEIPAVLETDADKLKKILYHLISNGLKYTKVGGVCVRLTSIPQEYGINLFLEVADTGIGMTEEETENIFRQFYQAESGRNLSSGGLGVGISIVNGFVRALGGFMTVKSQPDNGTIVRVSLPMKVVDETPCLKVDTPETISFVGYLNIRKFMNPHVRDYYNAMIKTLVQGISTPMRWVNTPDDLRTLADSLSLTHLIIGYLEYMRDPDLIEELAETMIVAVVADRSFSLPPASHAFLLPKPFLAFPAVDLLNKPFPENPNRKESLRFPDVNVLVVDDEPMNLSVAEGILRRYGMNVTPASSGKEAIALCQETDFDLIFMDHMMPEMDGIEAMHQIRSGDTDGQHHIPIIMLTANTLSTSREMFADAGADGFVGKPIETAELERLLEQILPDSAISRAFVSERIEAAEVSSPQDPEQNNFTDVMEELGRFGIDTKEGLRYCQNDMDFYREMLSLYAAEAADKTESLRQFYQSEDFSNYAIVVHTLKSTSKMIGADELSEIAQKSEAAAKSLDTETVSRLHGSLLESYTALTEKIRSLIETDSFLLEDDDIIEFMPCEEDES